MPNTLSAHGIDVSYTPRGALVLRGVELNMVPGAFVGVIGPNGSGKSTLVRALSRVLRPARGGVTLEGQDLYEFTARQSAQAIGVVPQTASASLGFTVREIVEMGRAPHLSASPFASLTAADISAVDNALRAAGVSDMAQRHAPTLSGGEWQRVLLARALAQDTPFLLLDEPTAHLDIHHQRHALALARTLAHEGSKAVLAVLHDLNLASEFCDHLVLVSGGQIIAQGPPATVLTETLVEQVYGARVWVRRHPLSGRPLALVLPEADKVKETLTGQTVHVVCGASTGAGVMTRLQEMGAIVTCGALNTDDPDADAARRFGVPFAQEAPFTPFSEATLATAGDMARAAQVIIITDVPFGPANVGSLRAAADARQSGVSVICLHPPGAPFAARDFTQGVAAPLWEQLTAGGTVLVPDIDALFRQLESLHGNHRAARS